MEGAEESLSTSLQNKKMAPAASICVGLAGLCFHIWDQSNGSHFHTWTSLSEESLRWRPAWRSIIWKSVRIAAYLPAYWSLPTPRVSPSCYLLEGNVMYHIARKSEISKLHQKESSCTAPHEPASTSLHISVGEWGVCLSVALDPWYSTALS